MGLLTFSINLTLDGCVDHQESHRRRSVLLGRTPPAALSGEAK
jgi:hypothetical protein